ncbi:hypothetical protein [Rhizobium sp. SYY.PMSO]
MPTFAVSEACAKGFAEANRPSARAQALAQVRVFGAQLLGKLLAQRLD